MAVDVDRFREAYIRIVPAKAMTNPVICSLDESAHIVGDPPAGKEAHLLHHEIVVHAKSGGCAALLRGLRIGKGGLQHHREGRAAPITAAQGVAAELEAPAERGQLQKGGVARRTWLAGLACVEGKRDGTPRSEVDRQDCCDYCHPDKNSRQRPPAA